ncbi:MAG: methyl-accepting chemotaxis protein [Lachnospiraceae bacterium]
MNMSRNGLENEVVKERLSSRIGRTVAASLCRALIIVCLESILIGGFFIIIYEQRDNRRSAREYTEMIDSAMQNKISVLEAIAAGVSSGILTDSSAVQKYVDSMVVMDDQISAVYSCYDENIVIMSGGWEPTPGFDVTKRDWYIGAQANPQKVFVSEPYVDTKTGGICITLAKATYNNGKLMGVVGMDLYTDDLTSLIQESFAGENYIFLTTAKGEILVHPNAEYSMTADKISTVQEVNSGKYQFFIEGDMATRAFTDYKGGLKIGIGSTSSITGWKVISIKDLSLIELFFVVLFVVNLLICFITTAIARRNINRRVGVLFRPLESISGKMTRIAEGDLTVIFDEEKNSMEIERLTDSINETITGLKFYIESISDTVTAISDKNLTVKIDGEFKGSYVQIKEALESIIKNLSKTFKQIIREAENVLEFADKLDMTTENVAQSASMQNESVSNVSKDMAELTEQTKRITERAVSIRDIAELTKTHLEDGNREMTELVKAMESIQSCYDEIAGFVGIIKDIAAQTNLLSLNASIEAARAGEAGRGFAVVAGEISTLAASSAQASENINKLIEESQAAVFTGKKLVTATSATIQQGMDDSVQSKHHIDEIVEFVEKQQKAIEGINEELKEVAGIVENNAASAEENTAISQQLNECAQSLKQMADSFTLD